MATSAMAPSFQEHSMDQLDAARALLGVSPAVTETSKVSDQNSFSNTGGGLDALAALASTAHNMDRRGLHYLSSSDDDSEAMPPPPPRRRPRSVSNPEGMEKWDSLNQSRYNRLHFVLPSSILEEELAEASAAARRHKEKENAALRLPFKKRGSNSKLGTSPNCVASPLMESIKEEEEEPPELDEADMTPAELLKRARSRLLEDLSEGSLTGEKGVLTLPHSLAKYKEVYNKNGRIGIYTPGERAAIIARFSKKRSRRMWKKKIRYNCRKNLADRRMRVKGRFVKRSTEENAKLAKPTTVPDLSPEDQNNGPTTEDNAAEPNDSNEVHDVDMPDVNDPEAGFAPTEDQPFRRMRRHTIT